MAKSSKTASSDTNDLLSAPPPVFDVNRELLKGLISSFYQIQKVRIQIGNKLVAHFYRKLGIDASKKMLEEAQGDRKASLDMIDLLRLEYKRIADAIASKDEITQAKFNKLTDDDRGVFSEYVELSWMQNYRRSLNAENSVLRDIESTLEKFPIWTDFLVGIKGVGPTIGGVMVAFIDIHKAQTPASLWAFAGLDVVPIDRYGKEDGRGRGRFKSHLVEREYEDREGKQGVRDSITFNPIVKTKLVGLLAEIMVKHRTPIYRDEYDNYKLRITQREDLRENEAKAAGDTTFVRRSKLHINRMAYRYMIKRFLVHYYIKARTLEGLEVVPEYSIAKLGMVHHTAAGQWSQQARGPHRSADDIENDRGYPSQIAEEQTPPPL